MAVRRENKNKRGRKNATAELEDKFLKKSEIIYAGYRERLIKAEERRLERKNASIEEKRKLKSLPPFDSAHGFYKREAYFLLRKEFAAAGENTIKSIIRKYADEPRYPSFTKNRFYWGLVALDSAEELLTKQQLSKIAKQLLYANQNNVTPQFLVGFLYQIGGSDDLSMRLSRKSRDPSLNLTVDQSQ